MPSSKQQPLTARRGTHEHDFSQSYADWEAAVFDRATHFAVVEQRNKRKYSTWRYLPWAVKYCRQLDTGHWDIAGWCIYAVTANGRFTLLDHEKVDEWVQRWWENREGASGNEIRDDDGQELPLREMQSLLSEQAAD
jgi:hypothetical protein